MFLRKISYKFPDEEIIKIMKTNYGHEYDLVKNIYINPSCLGNLKSDFQFNEIIGKKKYSNIYKYLDKSVFLSEYYTLRAKKDNFVSFCSLFCKNYPFFFHY